VVNEVEIGRRIKLNTYQTTFIQGMDITGARVKFILEVPEICVAGIKHWNFLIRPHILSSDKVLWRIIVFHLGMTC
jgi:hypothetical protein